MKTIKLIYVFMALALVGCSKDDDGTATPKEPVAQAIPPTIALKSGSTDLFPGVIGAPQKGSLQHTVEAEAKDGFKSLEIQKLVDGSATSYQVIDENSAEYAGGNVVAYTLNYIFKEEDLGKDLSFRAIVTDQNDAKATLDFAQAEVKRPMIAANVMMKAAVPLNPLAINIPHYLMLRDDECLGISLEDIDEKQLYDQIIGVFSLNDGSGFYLASPNTLLEAELLNLFPEEKATTKFKELELTADEFEAFTIYETFEVEDLFAGAAFNADPEKLELVSEVDKVFTFRTDEGRIGLGRITGFDIANGEAILDLEIIVTQ